MTSLLHPLALAQVVAGVVLLISCSAVALSASRVRSLPARWSVPAVLAATAGNAVTPAGLGGTALMARLHTRTGLSADEALAAVTVRALASGVAGTAVAAFAAARFGLTPPSLPGGRTALVVLALVLLVAGALALSCPRRRRRLATHLRRTAGAAAHVLADPVRAGALLAGALGVVGAQLVLLDGAVRAVGGQVGLAALLVTLLGSSAARAALPIPGGVGPVEAVLVAGLTALGVPIAAAGLAVAVYRTAGLWLPVAAGAFALRALRRAALL